MFESLFAEFESNIRNLKPIICCVTNYVTVADCANVLLAFGASPIMSDEPDEVAEIVSLASGLNLNLGTLDRQTIPAMFVAGKRANELGIPVTLDPVGVGASALRTETAARLLREVRFAAIRGNMSEIRALADGSGATKGVDADASDAVDERNWRSRAEFLRRFAESLGGTTVVASGAIDLATDGTRVAAIRNGSPEAARITGAGCMLTTVVCAWIAANRTRVWEAATAATSAFGVCQELAAERTKAKNGGTATFRTELIDAASTTAPETFAERAEIETLDARRA